MEIDHIDLDRLNNRRSNLRICTHQQNQLNQPLQSNNTSGYAGVVYVKRKGRFSARIKFFQKEIHLGYYSSKIEAAQARNEAIKFLFKEFGILNDVPEAPYWIKAIVYEKCFSKIQVRASAANSMKEAC